MKTKTTVLLTAMACFTLFTLICCTKVDHDSITNDTISGGGTTENYVDLGLPSKTLWKVSNESNDFYTYHEAIELFDSNLPTKDQIEELVDYCEWSWNGNGWIATGTNGHSIFFPIIGYRSSGGNIFGINMQSNYWSSTPSDDFAYALYLTADGSVLVSDYFQGNGYCVRLVKNV